MAFKHTPGPWRIEGNWQFIAGGRGSGTGICIIEGMPYPSEKPGEAMRANARAIAAVPDLLAALERISSGVEFGKEAGIAREAIAKVTEPQSG